MSLSDRNAQNTGVTSVTSGPLIIRTYNNQSGNNTYLVTTNEYPVSTNYVLITSTGGQLVPSNNIYVSSITTSSITMRAGFFSTLTGASIATSSITMGTGLFSTLTGALETVSYLGASTIQASTIQVSTIQASTLVLAPTCAPSFSAYNSSATVGTSPMIITWNTTDWNIGNAYAAGAFTCPSTAPGVYSVSASCTPATTNTSITLSVYVNYVVYKTIVFPSGTTTSGPMLSCLVRLTSGAQVAIACTFGSSQGINNTSSGAYSYFQMCWLRSY